MLARQLTRARPSILPLLSRRLPLMRMKHTASPPNSQRAQTQINNAYLDGLATGIVFVIACATGGYFISDYMMFRIETPIKLDGFDSKVERLEAKLSDSGTEVKHLETKMYDLRMDVAKIKGTAAGLSWGK